MKNMIRYSISMVFSGILQLPFNVAEIAAAVLYMAWPVTKGAASLTGITDYLWLRRKK